MFSGNKFKNGLANVQKAVAERRRIDQAINTERSKLPAIVQKKLDAERALADAEASNVLGESGGESVGSARKSIESAQAEIDTIANRLAGLRSRRTRQCGDLATAHDNIDALWHEAAEKIESEFTAKWQEAVTAFSTMLARRHAIEELLGKRMNLPEPNRAGFDAAAAAQSDLVALAFQVPEIKAEIVRHLEFSAGVERMPDDVASHRRVYHGLTPYDASAAYTLLVDLEGLPAGTLVTDASFDPGLLDLAVGNQSAWPVGREGAPGTAKTFLEKLVANERQASRRQFESEAKAQIAEADAQRAAAEAQEPKGLTFVDRDGNSENLRISVNRGADHPHHVSL